MKFNVIQSQEEFEVSLINLKEQSKLDVNIKGRLLTISRYSDGYTIWWGGNYGVDCKNISDIIDTLEMLTSFIIEVNEDECFLTKSEEKFIRGCTKC